nr:beta-1,3-galactosyltransferase 1-like [Penaeus vannamei]
MIINNPKICNGDNAVSLLVQVSSAPGNFHRRRAIRDTWGGTSPLDASDAKLLFLLGNPRDSRIQTQVVEESRTHGDILQEDFVDSYMNLTIKSVMGLKWASTHCPQARFLMKTDDDMFINVPSLLTYLQEASASTWITGCIKQKKAFMPVNADPGVSLPPGHPPFVAGAGYVISGDLVGALYTASLRRRPIPVEDVYVTAHLARAVGVTSPVHDARFSCGEMVVDDCDLAQAFTGHRISPERMYHIWEKLNPNGITSPASTSESRTLRETPSPSAAEVTALQVHYLAVVYKRPNMKFVFSDSYTNGAFISSPNKGMSSNFRLKIIVSIGLLFKRLFTECS